MIDTSNNGGEKATKIAAQHPDAINKNKIVMINLKLATHMAKLFLQKIVKLFSLKMPEENWLTNLMHCSGITTVLKLAGHNQGI